MRFKSKRWYKGLSLLSEIDVFIEADLKDHYALLMYIDLQRPPYPLNISPTDMNHINKRNYRNE